MRPVTPDGTLVFGLMWNFSEYFCIWISDKTYSLYCCTICNLVFILGVIILVLVFNSAALMGLDTVPCDTPNVCAEQLFPMDMESYQFKLLHINVFQEFMVQKFSKTSCTNVMMCYHEYRVEPHYTSPVLLFHICRFWLLY